MGEMFSEWVSISNFLYLIGLIVAGYATVVTTKNRQIVIEIGELVKCLEEGYEDGSLDKDEKDEVMKEALDVAKAVIQSKWKLW
jgi:hypothetical protein